MSNRNDHDAALDALLAAATYEPPELQDDPAARLLGLVPDPSAVLNAAAMKRARMKAQLSASGLAQRLTSRGWRVTTGEIMRWESRSGTVLIPAMVAAISNEIGLLPSDLAQKVASDPFQALRESPGFKRLAQRWASIQHISLQAAMASLENRSLQTVHRGDAPEVEQQLGVLTAFVDEVENRNSK